MKKFLILIGVVIFILTVDGFVNGYDSIFYKTMDGFRIYMNKDHTDNSPIHQEYIEYKVFGSDVDSVFLEQKTVSVTFYNESGGISQHTIKTPWSYEFEAKIGQVLSISAQNQGNQGSVIVEIYRGGILYKRSESSGPYCIALAVGINGLD